MAKDKFPNKKEILEVMRMAGCDRRTARRRLIEAFREVDAAYALLINALCKGQISARGTNTKTGKQENIPASYWSR